MLKERNTSGIIGVKLSNQGSKFVKLMPHSQWNGTIWMPWTLWRNQGIASYHMVPILNLNNSRCMYCCCSSSFKTKWSASSLIHPYSIEISEKGRRYTAVVVNSELPNGTKRASGQMLKADYNLKRITPSHQAS